ncbi:MAG TPA: stage II sporulation protein M [Candidatus Nitrosotalea sp.]|nr:stage II sporulation protein M [Candidatus Nitrosotalea sp.]
MSKKIRLALFAVFVGFFLSSYLVGSAYKMSDEEQQTFLKDFQGLTEDIDAFGIFLHNAGDAMPMFVPAFGVAWGSYTAWSTGAAFHALLSTNPTLEKISPLAVFLVSPYGVMELAAYSIGISRGCLVMISLIKRKNVRRQIKPVIIEVGIVLGLLLVAAFVEYSFIHQVQK